MDMHTETFFREGVLVKVTEFRSDGALIRTNFVATNKYDDVLNVATIFEEFEQVEKCTSERADNFITTTLLMMKMLEVEDGR